MAVDQETASDKSLANKGATVLLDSIQATSAKSKLVDEVLTFGWVVVVGESDVVAAQNVLRLTTHLLRYHFRRLIPE